MAMRRQPASMFLMPSVCAAQLEYVWMCPGNPESTPDSIACTSAFRLALRGNEIIPASRHGAAGIQAQDAVGQRIALVVVEEQPAVQLLFSQCFLNFVKLHDQVSKKGFHFCVGGAAVNKLTRIRLTTDAPRAG